MTDAFLPAPPTHHDPLPALLKRLEIQEATINELTGLATELCGAVTALKAFANAVALSHPQPERLLSVFQDHMDLAADALKPEQIEIYRKDLHHMQNAILLAVQRQNGKSS